MLVFSNENAMSKALSGELELPFALSFISKKDLFNRISDTEYEYATSLKIYPMKNMKNAKSIVVCI